MDSKKDAMLKGCAATKTNPNAHNFDGHVFHFTKIKGLDALYALEER